MDSNDGLCDGDRETIAKADDRDVIECGSSAVTDHGRVVLDSKENGSLFHLFSRFESFNFDDDQRFQSGLSKITSLPDFNQTNHLLKVKAFYYSKNVEPLDFATYMNWSQKQRTKPDSSKVLQESHTLPESDDGTGNDKNNADADETSTHPSSDSLSMSGSVRPAVEESNPSNAQLKAENQSKDSGNISNDSSCSQELSFAEIAEMIQNGKPVPGLTAFEVLPTNDEPSPSQLPRAKKPWEE